jgi:hypothetical protein
MHLNLRDKIWEYTELDEVIYEDVERWGLCSDPSDKNKRIIVSKKPQGIDRLSVIIHEALHACLWDLDEEAIVETAGSISLMLWRLGYRDK